jgi:hypothetical protein
MWVRHCSLLRTMREVSLLVVVMRAAGMVRWKLERRELCFGSFEWVSMWIRQAGEGPGAGIEPAAAPQLGKSGATGPRTCVRALEARPQNRRRVRHPPVSAKLVAQVL